MSNAQRFPNRFVGRMPVPELGKVVDHPRNKPGSRADQHWGGLTTPEQMNKFISKFSLHSIEFGNWVRTGEREEAFENYNQALADLAYIMNVPQKDIGFNGKLSVSFGSRGRGTALATYYPGIHHINLTKTKGAGSLAHEYGHAIDFFPGRKQATPPSGGRSTIFVRRSHSGIAGLFDDVFQALLFNKDGSRTAFAKGLGGYSKYWRRREEIWARTFEAWVGWQARKKGRQSFFLHSRRYKSKVYPDQRLLEKADPYIRQIITRMVGR